MRSFNLISMASAGLVLLASMPFSATAQNAELFKRQLEEVEAEDICYPIPIIDTPDGYDGVFAVEKYLVVTVSEPEDRTFLLDNLALDASIEQAYAASIECVLSPGSIRALVNCSTVVEGVNFEPFSYLMYCDAYATNSADGDIVFNDVDPYTDETCDCACGDLGEYDFLGMVAPDGTCPCTCTGNRADCMCPAPFLDTMVNIMNELYQAKTDPIGVNVTIESITDVEITYDDCDYPNLSYNNSFVCVPPDETPSPTAKPTHRPTPHPTRNPTNKPTRKPTRKPSKRPTKKPTPHPTADPTRAPTPVPTEHPTPIPTEEPSVSSFPTALVS